MKDLIADLPKGKYLFNQKFVTHGFLTESAKTIIAENLQNRFAIIVKGSTFSGYFFNIDLGVNGHGFGDKRSANARITKLKKKNDSVVCTVFNLNDLEAEINKAFDENTVSWWKPHYVGRSMLTLCYA